MTPADFTCAWCQRVRPHGGEWQQSLPDDLRLSATTLGICPDCLSHETGAALAGGVVLSLTVFEGH